LKANAITPDDFPWYDYSRYSFSLGLDVGNHAYLSGHTASTYNPDLKRVVVADGMAEQARIAYAKIEAILKASGKTLNDAVRVVEYITAPGVASYDEAEKIRLEIFGDRQPVVNTVPVRALLRPDALIELEVIAAPKADHEADNLIFLPTIHGPDGGDVVSQTSAIYDEAARLLKQFDLGLDSLIKTVEYVTPNALANYKGTAEIRKQRLGPVYPAATGIIMPQLMRPGSLIQMDLVASRDTPEAINPGWKRFDKLTYSPGVRAGNKLFVSGSGAIDPETGQFHHEGDVAGQADYIYRNILRVVDAAGGTAANLVKTIEYTTPAALPGYRGVADVRRELMARPYPASTGPVCEALLRREMLIEIDSFAILDS
jgi:enamine deaminase RidA (YjgF/YER057c/UK114 family)